MTRAVRSVAGAFGFAFAIATVFPAQTAFADVSLTPDTSGFNAQQLDPAERGSEFFVADSLHFQRSHAIGVVTTYGRKSLVIHEDDGSLRAAVIKHQLFAHLGGSFVFADSYRIALDVPIAMFQQGSDTSILGAPVATAPSRGAMGDVRVGFDAILFGNAPASGKNTFRFGVGAQVHIPTGSRENFTSDGSLRASGRVSVGGEIGPLTYASHVGVRYRSRGSFGDVSRGNELFGSAALGLRLFDNHLMLGPELTFSSSFAGAGPFATTSTGGELLFGAHFQDNHVRVGVGAGPGIGGGLGVPEFRAMARLEWLFAALPEPIRPPAKTSIPLPDAPAADRDHDGIPDITDACVDLAGPASADPKTSGCPGDRDGDGVVDTLDVCPDVKGLDLDDPKTRGCPPDRDGDGVLDADDLCPNDKGTAINRGCAPDIDHDGISNADDACPFDAGVVNADKLKNGCPVARVSGSEVKITEPVFFKTASAELVGTSKDVLEAVYRVLVAHPEIEHLRVEGHSDEAGDLAANKKLSTERAAAVVAWLLKRGTEKSRLSSEGFGSERPRDTSGEAGAKASNRRVEFHVIKR